VPLRSLAAFLVLKALDFDRIPAKEADLKDCWL